LRVASRTSDLLRVRLACSNYCQQALPEEPFLCRGTCCQAAWSQKPGASRSRRLLRSVRFTMKFSVRASRRPATEFSLWQRAQRAASKDCLRWRASRAISHDKHMLEAARFLRHLYQQFCTTHKKHVRLFIL